MSLQDQLAQMALLKQQECQLNINIALIKWAEWVYVCTLPVSRRARELYTVLEMRELPLLIRNEAAEELIELL